MSLTVLTPSSGGLFGPGFTVTVETDLIGPLEPGSFWTFELSAPAGEEVMTRKFVGFVANQMTTVMYSGTNITAFLTEARPEWTTGASGRLRITLDEPGSGVVDSINVPVTIDREAGQNQELAAWLQANPVTSGAGLTPEEHAAVLQTNVGVIALSTLNPLDLVGDLAEAISGSPPLGFGSFSATYTLEGDGEMPDIGDVLHTKLGIHFVAIEIPAGLSHRHGQSEEYPARLVQWRTVHTVAGVELVTQVMDFITHGEMLRWQHAKPTRIEYSILPGVIMEARWWQFP